MHYHDKEGNPIVNSEHTRSLRRNLISRHSSKRLLVLTEVVFPDLKGMADHAHGLGLTSG